MAKKWQRVAALTSKRLAPPSTSDEETEGSCCTLASKGHCVVYLADGGRFKVPLAYLGTAIFGELLQMSEEQFGFTGGVDSRRIILPCEAAVMEYMVCLLRRGASKEVETAFLSSMERLAAMETMAWRN